MVQSCFSEASSRYQWNVATFSPPLSNRTCFLQNNSSITNQKIISGWYVCCSDQQRFLASTMSPKSNRLARKMRSSHRLSPSPLSLRYFSNLSERLEGNDEEGKSQLDHPSHLQDNRLDGMNEHKKFDVIWTKNSSLDNSSNLNYAKDLSQNGSPMETLAGGEGSGTEIAEESLLNLLDSHDNKTDKSISAPIGSDKSRNESNQEESLLDILNKFSNQTSSKSYQQQYLQSETPQEDSLMDLIQTDLPRPENYSRFSRLFSEDATGSTATTTEETVAQRYKRLYNTQLKFELESFEDAMEKYMDILTSARNRSDHATIPKVRRAVTSWYEPLTEAIELEQWLYLNGDYKTKTGDLILDKSDGVDLLEKEEAGHNPNVVRVRNAAVKDRTIYGPLLCLLPPRKIAVLIAHTAFSGAMVGGEEGQKVVSLALQLATTLETEVNVSRALRVRAYERSKRGIKMESMGNLDGADLEEETDAVEIEATPQIDTSHLEHATVDEWVYTATHLQRFIDELSRKSSGGVSLKSQGRVRPALVRKRCQEILYSEGFFRRKNETNSTESSLIPQRPLSMNEFVEWDPVLKVKLGAALIRFLLENADFCNPMNRGMEEPAFNYTRRKTDGMKFNAFISIHPDLLSIALEDDYPSYNANMASTDQYMRCQPMVVPPKKWTDVHGGGYQTLKVDFMRTRQCKTQKDAISNADLSKVFDGLNVLGQIPWKINKRVFEVAQKCWEEGISLGDIPPQVDYEVPPLPERMEYRNFDELDGEQKKIHLEEFRSHKDAATKHFRFKQKNMDLHSLRCSAKLKLMQAKKFMDFQEIFFPYNVDFRGRAYPVPPHLSIVGSDLCRALLMFAHPKPLGPNGLYWLKVHLANLAGADKMSFDGRANFADENMKSIRAAVDDPFGEDRWWMNLDDPFQGLATCHEIVNAIDSGDPESYMCSLPVHMDGSCNGLQHYAALGRDKVGGKAVNLCIADKPQDVYIGVMHEVIRRVALDAEEMLDFDENKIDLTKQEKEQLKRVKSARLVNGLIDRGVVKRTVMTSVYGVTYIGARNQIKEKIEEKLEEKGNDIDEMEAEINLACGYLAALTMEVMGQLFIGARQTMNWLTECARLISALGQPVAFISPIGVPVVQPYRQKRPFTVVTLLQNIVLTNDSDTLPLHRSRQVSAFPPNYVHSLDSSHMLLTAVEMKKRGLYFSAVHDSYWTHPCDIEEMNVILRECFIDLYNIPLLEDLKKMWELRYPSITFPEVPARGDLDLNDVRSAPYFFQ